MNNDKSSHSSGRSLRLDFDTMDTDEFFLEVLGMYSIFKPLEALSPEEFEAWLDVFGTLLRWKKESQEDKELSHGK